MSVRHPSRVTRRLLQIASLGLAGLLAGLLTGCTSASNGWMQHADNGGWQTSSTYASATASFAPGTTQRVRPCYAGPCGVRFSSARVHPSRHGSM